MKRISPAGCGYSLVPGVSYTCSGIPKLNPAFAQTPLKAATSNTWLTEMDNYNNVPQSIEGFIMTLVPIIDMSGASSGISLPEVPELECRVNSDPFVDEEDSVLHTGSGWSSVEETENTGFLDMFHYGPGYEDKVYVVVNGSTHHLHEGQTLTMLPAFSNGVDVYMMKPGVLEPMVDTSFAPINVDVNPPDLDGPNTAIAILNKWRHEADLRFRDLYSKIRPWIYDDSNVNGLINLEAAQNLGDNCPNFQIRYMYEPGIDPPTLVKLVDGVDPTAGSHFYIIGGGTVYVNGDLNNPVEVRSFFDPDDEGSEAAEEQGSLISAPFQAYLEYDITGNTASIKVNNAKFTLLRRNNCLYYYIGEVKTVRSTDITIEAAGTDYMLYELIQGDCITDITIGGGDGKGYEGPFKVSMYSTGTYIARGTTVTADPGVVGAPTVPFVASKDYISYTYTITDASQHIPNTVSTKYAGYSVIDGVNYTPELKYIFSVDSETDATVYMMYTKGDTGWTSEYKVNVGCGTASIPATDGLIIGSTTSVNLSSLDVGDTYEDDGTTYTVESINGREVVVSYTNPTTQTKETAVCEAPQRYVVPIGYVSGSAVGQVQYGDIFLDMQDIEGGSTPPGDLVYTGPFRVVAEYLTDQQLVVKVHGISYDYNLSSSASASQYVKYAGRVVLEGLGVNEVVEAIVQTPQVDSQTQAVTYVTPATGETAQYPAGIFDVYAVISLTATESSYLYSACDFIARRSADFSPSSVTVTDGTVKYWVRLARCYSASTGAIYVEQTQFGDIYVDIQKIKEAITPTEVSPYNGPFKLGFNGTSKTVTISGTSTDTDNDGTYAGRIYLLGKFASWANLPAASVAVGEVYAHVVKTALGAYNVVYNNSQSYTSPTTTDTVYTIRLGKVTAVEKDTIPVEVSGTVVNVAVHAIIGTEQSPQANPCVVQLDATQSTGYRIVAPGPGVTGSVITLYNSANDPIYVTVQVDGTGTPITVPLFTPTIDQYHMGDIYLDTDDIEEYNGPFKVVQSESGQTVELFAFDGNNGTTQDPHKIVGKVIRGSTVTDTPDSNQTTTTHTATDGLYGVEWNSAISVTAAGTIIYAHIYLTKETPTATVQPYSIQKVEFDTKASPTIAPTTANSATAASKVYTYRIAKIGSIDTSSTTPATYAIKVIQIQHGDIYLGDVSDPIEQATGTVYDGPFKVTASVNGTDTTKADITITGPDKDTDVSHTTRAGLVCINGADCHLVQTGTITGVTVGSFIYARITGTSVTDISYDDGTQVTPTNTTESTSATPPPYTVRLAKVTGTTSVEQYHYGDIYVDGRWS